MTASFRVHRVLDLPTRGRVVMGEIVDGTIASGDWMVPASGSPLRVDAVEDVRASDQPPGAVGLVLRGAPPLAEVERRLPPGTTVVLSAPLGTPVASAAPACHRGLRRYWFPLSIGLGIGVTAASDDEARALAMDAQRRTAPDATLLEPIVDVDVRTLDAGHVQPNIGPVVVRGVWFPNENLGWGGR